MRLYPFTWLPACHDVKYAIPFTDIEYNPPFCGKFICSIHGKWHIAWQLPARYSYFLDNSYPVMAFLLPLLYGAWRVTIFHVISGPFLAWLTTDNSNEWAAVWCLYSIALLGLMVKSPIRKHLYQKATS
jgi:hypothetical protein